MSDWKVHVLAGVFLGLLSIPFGILISHFAILVTVFYSMLPDGLKLFCKPDEKRKFHSFFYGLIFSIPCLLISVDCFILAVASYWLHLIIDYLNRKWKK